MAILPRHAAMYSTGGSAPGRTEELNVAQRLPRAAGAMSAPG
jgi:hypothetical protein